MMRMMPAVIASSRWLTMLLLAGQLINICEGIVTEEAEMQELVQGYTTSTSGAEMQGLLQGYTTRGETPELVQGYTTRGAETPELVQGYTTRGADTQELVQGYDTTGDGNTFDYVTYSDDATIPATTAVNTTTANTTISQCVKNAGTIKIPLILACICLSIIACLSAFLVYILIAKHIFRDMADNIDVTKHWIHLNFMASFLLRDLTLLILILFTVFFKTFTLQFGDVDSPVDLIVPAFLTYANIACYYWMFAEGFTLYISVFHPFMDLSRYRWFKMKICMIGWTTPAIFIALWMVTEVLHNAIFVESGNATHTISLHYFQGPELAFILIPIYILLFVNLVMMCRILRKVSCMLQQEQERIKRRLTKATIALSLLLGIPFIIPVILLNPVSKANFCAGVILSISNDVPTYTQGLFVAIFYVLTNDEVIRYTRRHIQIPQTPRISWSRTPRSSRDSRESRDSPSSRTPRSSRSSSSQMSGGNNNDSIQPLNGNLDVNHHLNDTTETRV